MRAHGGVFMTLAAAVLLVAVAVPPACAAVPPVLRCWTSAPKPLSSLVAATKVAAQSRYRNDDGPAPCPVRDAFSTRIMMRDTWYVDGNDTPQPPPRAMPRELVPYYTRCGAIPVATSYYVDDTEKGQGTHYRYSQADIQQLLDKARRKLHSGDRPVRGSQNEWLINALRAHPLTNKRVVVFGSMEPWVEAYALASHARQVITVEYNALTYEWPYRTADGEPVLQTVRPHELAGVLGGKRVDAVLSISSFDHDGLGRYGDPLGPDSDLLAMDCVRSLLSLDGGDASGSPVLYLTVPVGPDAIAWNLHRRYGNRLQQLLYGWEHLGGSPFGWDVSRAQDMSVPITKSYEPVFVMRPNKAVPLDVAPSQPPAAARRDEL